MTSSTLSRCLLRRPEIPQGRMDDSIDWIDTGPPMLDEQYKAKKKRERNTEARKRAAAKATAKRRAKTAGKHNTGWHKQSRRDWKARQQ